MDGWVNRAIKCNKWAKKQGWTHDKKMKMNKWMNKRVLRRTCVRTSTNAKIDSKTKQRWKHERKKNWEKFWEGKKKSVHGSNCTVKTDGGIKRRRRTQPGDAREGEWPVGSEGSRRSGPWSNVCGPRPRPETGYCTCPAGEWTLRSPPSASPALCGTRDGWRSGTTGWSIASGWNTKAWRSRGNVLPSRRVRRELTPAVSRGGRLQPTAGCTREYWHRSLACTSTSRNRLQLAELCAKTRQTYIHFLSF